MAQADSFVHLHVHSHYSLLDGACKIEELVGTAKKFGMPAVAVTDHGSMFGAVEFYREATREGIKPIIGYEAYVAPGRRQDREITGGIKEAAFHLTLLAENATGYHNLAKLATTAYLDGFYYKPRIDWDVLSEHHEGIICLSGCLKSQISHLIQADRYDEAKAVADRYRQLFGDGRYYLEIQENGIDEQRVVNEGEARLAKDLGIPLVATNDIHYMRKGDAEAHEVLLCINTGKLLTDEDRMSFGSDAFYFASPKDMAARFKHHPEALTATLDIAERCNVDFDFGVRHFPPFDSGEMTNDEHLRSLAYAELGRWFKGSTPQAMVDRIEEELDVIREMEYASYFLIVRDLVDYARHQGIPVGLRGSAAGTLIARCLNMTDFDPVKHGLLFKRFLDPERAEPPDIDIDLCERRREDVIQYVRDKYGEESVAQIITFGTLGARAAVRDVGRVLDMPLKEVDEIAKEVPEVLHITLAKALEQNPGLRSRYDRDSRVKRLIDLAMRLEGLARHSSIHAAGVVIGDRPLVEHLPLSKSGDTVTTQFVFGDVEEIGLLKMDFLGLRSLTICQTILDLIREETGDEFTLADIALDDEETYKLLHRGEAEGIFQLASSGMRNLLTRLEPNNIEEIIALVALYRPGPLQSGMVDRYINCKHGREPITYLHPSLEPHLKETYGLIVYQEQIMQLAHDIGSLSMGEALTMIKAISKKKEEVIKASRDAFIQGAIANGMDKASATEIYELIEHFAGYGFNKAHSTSYAYLAYRMAYLRAHYPVQFFAGSMTCEHSNRDQVNAFVKDANAHGIKILPPHVSNSYNEFRTEGRQIRFGMSAIKGVGDKAVDAIVEARGAGGAFKSLFDFCERVDSKAVNRSAAESLIRCGAFDGLGGTRAQLLAALDDAIQMAAHAQRDLAKGQMSLFGAIDDAETPDHKLPDVKPLPDKERYTCEKELLGFYVSGHPLAEYEDLLKMYATATTADLSSKEDGEEVLVGGIIDAVKPAVTRRGRFEGQRWARFEFSDLEGSARGVMFAQEYAQYGKHLVDNAIVFIQARVDYQGNEPQLRAQQMVPMRAAHHMLAGGIMFDIDSADADAGLITQIRDLCASHNGEMKTWVRIHTPDEGAFVIEAGTSMRVQPSAQLLAAARRLVGEARVRYTPRRNGNGNGNGNGRRRRRSR